MKNCHASDTVRIESLAEGRAVTTVGYNWLEAYDLWKHGGQAEAVRLRARVAELEAALLAATTTDRTGRGLSDARGCEMGPPDLPELMRNGPVPGVMWRHKKSSNHYTVVGNCIIEETLTPAVIYERNGIVWCRPRAEFLEKFVRVE